MRHLRLDKLERRNPRQGQWTRLLPALMIVMLITLAVVALVEFILQRGFSNLSHSLSQLITIAFSAFAAMIAAYLAFHNFISLREHDQTVRALSESEERYRTLFERVPVGLYRTTPDGRIIDANPALVEMLGYPYRESLMAMNARDFYILPEDRDREMGMLANGNQTGTMEIQLRRYDGSIIWIRDTVRSVKGKEGRVIYYDGSLEEITGRKRAEEALLLLASIVESSDDAIIGETLDSVIVSWNSGAERIYGYSADEVIGRSISLILPPDRADEMTQILARINQGERVDHYETVRVRKDGRQIDISLSVSPIKDGMGKIIGLSKIARDISEHKRMEQYMLRTERLAAMGQISASLAHEVKNPLQAVESNLDLLLDFPLDPDEREECLKICRREVDRLVEITQRMLIFSQINPSSYREISIAPVWQETLALMDKALRSANVKVFTYLPEDLPKVTGVEGLFRQVLLNLVLNSVEALAGGGSIALRGCQESEKLVLTLVNNGPPIPEEILAHIFEPFFTSKPSGSGLGLFISQNIIQQNGGTLCVENLKDQAGVAFIITLPIAGS